MKGKNKSEIEKEREFIKSEEKKTEKERLKEEDDFKYYMEFAEILRSKLHKVDSKITERIENKKEKRTPNLSKIRKVVYWDTSFELIDWEKYRRAVIQRIFERGNETEINEIIDFYGFDIVKEEVEIIHQSYLPTFQKNVDKYIKKRK